MKKEKKKKPIKKSAESTLKKELTDFLQVNGHWTLLIRTLILICIIVGEWVAIYFIFKNNFNEKLSDEINNTLLSIVIALFALQIAVYTLILQPYKSLQDGINARKLLYIKAIKTNKLPYVEQVYNSFDETMLQNDRIFRFVACELHILLVYVGVVVLVEFLPIASLLCRFTFLLANVILQFLFITQFLNMLHSLFIRSKLEVKGMMDVRRAQIQSQIKYHRPNSDDINILDIALAIDEMYEQIKQ